MNVLVVFSHPRRDSLTAQVAGEVVAGLVEAGHEPEVVDLYSEGFDPVLGPEDEPDWQSEDKVYSAAVREEIARMERNQAIILVFPIWWWSFPAMMKGWIDRVWNKDYAYGGARLGHRKALAVGLSASDAEGYAKRGHDTAIETEIVTGLFEFCGIEDGAFVFLHHSTDGGEWAAGMLREAREIGRTFIDPAAPGTARPTG